jgi:AcrR family transcriptional regulator
MATAPRRRYAPRLPPEQRREQILDAALALVERDGYVGATMEAVAREAGVAKPVVYDAFATRPDLLRALLSREEERALEQLAAAIPAPRDAEPRELLRDGLAAFFGAVLSEPRRWRLILLPAEGTSDVVRAHVERGRAEALGRLEQLVDAVARSRGEEIDVELTAHAILALGEHGARLVLTAPERFTPERVATFVAQLVAPGQR